jgi:hypothetical protein
MIKALDILQTAENIIRGSQTLNPNDSNYMGPGSFVTVDLPGSGDQVYKVISHESEDTVKLENTKTKKIFVVPMEFLSVVLVDDPNDYEDINTFLTKNKDDVDGLGHYKVSQLGIKKPIDLKTDSEKGGIYVLGNQSSYNRSRYDKTNQLPPK